jgi:hypothetical protein
MTPTPEPSPAPSRARSPILQLARANHDLAVAVAAAVEVADLTGVAPTAEEFAVIGRLAVVAELCERAVYGAAGRNPNN